MSHYSESTSERASSARTATPGETTFSRFFRQSLGVSPLTPSPPRPISLLLFFTFLPSLLVAVAQTPSPSLPPRDRSIEPAFQDIHTAATVDTQAPNAFERGRIIALYVPVDYACLRLLYVQMCYTWPKSRLGPERVRPSRSVGPAGVGRLEVGNP